MLQNDFLYLCCKKTTFIIATYCFSIKKVTFYDAENVGITIHMHGKGKNTELLPTL